MIESFGSGEQVVNENFINDCKTYEHAK